MLYQKKNDSNYLSQAKSTKYDLHSNKDIGDVPSREIKAAYASQGGKSVIPAENDDFKYLLLAKSIKADFHKKPTNIKIKLRFHLET